jgi:hypothetical protein
MAKSSRRTAGSASAAWLTAPERRVLDSTVGTPLSSATRNQLMSVMKQARTLRDKWRDLFNRQTISTKRTPGGRNDPANTRSLEKSDLFAAAVKRLEARLAELTGSTGGGTGRSAAGRIVVKKPARKPARQAGHRATRAGIRGMLAETVATLNTAARGSVEQVTGQAKPAKPKNKPKKKKATVAAARKAAPAKAPGAREPSTAAKQTGTKRAGTKRAAATASKKARQAGTLRALAASGTGQALHFDAKKQRSAKARATAARIKFDGLSTRRRGHTLAAGKRKQARRDGR